MKPAGYDGKITRACLANSVKLTDTTNMVNEIGIIDALSTEVPLLETSGRLFGLIICFRSGQGHEHRQNSIACF